MVVDYLSLTLTALSDPTRRALLGRLARGPASVNELARPFNISQQAVSKHLAYLQRARLVDKRRDGRRQSCALNPAPFKAVAIWVADCERLWEESVRHLDLVIEEMKKRNKHGHGK